MWAVWVLAAWAAFAPLFAYSLGREVGRGREIR